MNAYQIVIRPWITEAATSLIEQNQYVFEVAVEANKIQIRQAVEALFTQPDGRAVEVTDVNTLNMKGKERRFRAFRRASVGRTAGYKKALVTLAEGHSIQIFEGV